MLTALLRPTPDLPHINIDPPGLERTLSQAATKSNVSLTMTASDKSRFSRSKETIPFPTESKENVLNDKL